MIKQKKPQLISPLLIAISVVLLVVWGFYALTTGNPLWFRPMPERSYDFDRIVIYHYGNSIEAQSGSDEFRALEAALNQALGRFRGRVPVGLSNATLEDYYEKEFVIELLFSSDIGLTISLSDTTVNQLLIPIDGRHSGNRFVFVGNNDDWLASALIMEDPQPIFTVLDELGYSAK